MAGGDVRPTPFHVESGRERISQDDESFSVVGATGWKKIVVVGRTEVVAAEGARGLDHPIGTDDHHSRGGGGQTISEHRIE